MPLILKMGTRFLKYGRLRNLLVMKNKGKKFDAVKLMRELRDQVDKEIENMTAEQVVEYFRIYRDKFETEMAGKKHEHTLTI